MSKCNESRAKKPQIVAGAKAGRPTIATKKFPAGKPTLWAKAFAAVGNLLRCLPDSYYFQQIVLWLEKIECWLTCEPERQTSTIAVDDTLCLLRWPDTRAIVTIVQNLGEAEFWLYEDHRLIGIVQPHAQRPLPLSGRMLVEGRCNSGESTSVLVTTERRCLCGDIEVYSYSSNQPIGGNLL